MDNASSMNGYRNYGAGLRYRTVYYNGRAYDIPQLRRTSLLGKPVPLHVKNVQIARIPDYTEW